MKSETIVSKHLFQCPSLLFAEVKEKYGRLDVLIHNAAVVSAFGKTCDIPLEAFHQIMDVNLTGSWLVLR